MAIIKSYTDIEQSRKLAEILPLESADGYWFKGFPPQPYMVYTKGTFNPGKHTPCWSLTALLDVLPYSIEFSQLEFTKKSVAYRYKTTDVIKIGVLKDNLVDACYEMILKLHELERL